MFENKTFKKGDVIFLEGQWEMCMYYILSGKVGIYAGWGTEGQKLLTTLEEGKYFGEMGLVEAYPRSATAVAEEDLDTTCIDGDGLSAYFAAEPQKVVDILTNLTARLRQLSDEYMEVCRAAGDYLDAENGSGEKAGTLKKIKGFIARASHYVLKYQYATTDPNAFQNFYKDRV